MKVWQSWMGWKMPLCKWHTFWMVSRLICYLNFILFFIERKWLFMRNLATILLLKSKLSRKFQRFNAIDGSIKMLKKKLNFKKLHLNWKIVKHFLRAKQPNYSASPNPQPPDKPLLGLWNKNFPTRIYRNIQTFAIKVLQQWGSWASRNGAVQMFLLTPNRTMCAG